MFGPPSVVFSTMLTSRDDLILKRIFSLEPGVARARKLDKPSGLAILLIRLPDYRENQKSQGSVPFQCKYSTN